MFKHTVVILTITALVSLNVSCTKIVSMSAEEAEGKSQDKILEIGLSSEIREIVHRSEMMEVQVSRDAVIVFDKSGGVLDTNNHVISGLTLTGRKVNIPLKEVLYLKVNRFDLLNTALAIVIPTVLFLYVKNNPPDLDLGGFGN